MVFLSACKRSEWRGRAVVSACLLQVIFEGGVLWWAGGTPECVEGECGALNDAIVVIVSCRSWTLSQSRMPRPSPQPPLFFLLRPFFSVDYFILLSNLFWCIYFVYWPISTVYTCAILVLLSQSYLFEWRAGWLELCLIPLCPTPVYLTHSLQIV